jgi:hypothetical protein
VGDGNNTIDVQPDVFSDYSYSTLPCEDSTPLPPGWAFNYAPDQTTVGITLGSGNNKVELQECSATITAASGTSTISLVDGHNALILGSGTATVTIAAYDTTGPIHFSLAKDRGSDIVQLGTGHADISIDDTMKFMTPQTTIVIARGETGAESGGAADDIRYGHYTGSDFVGGDWSAVTFDLVGYDLDSEAVLTRAGDHTEMTIRDTADGSTEVMNLYGAPPGDIAGPHVRFT